MKITYKIVALFTENYPSIKCNNHFVKRRLELERGIPDKETVMCILTMCNALHIKEVSCGSIKKFDYGCKRKVKRCTMYSKSLS